MTNVLTFKRRASQDSASARGSLLRRSDCKASCGTRSSNATALHHTSCRLRPVFGAAPRFTR